MKLRNGSPRSTVGQSARRFTLDIAAAARNDPVDVGSSPPTVALSATDWRGQQPALPAAGDRFRAAVEDAGEVGVSEERLRRGGGGFHARRLPSSGRGMAHRYRVEIARFRPVPALIHCPRWIHPRCRAGRQPFTPRRRNVSWPWQPPPPTTTCPRSAWPAPGPEFAAALRRTPRLSHRSTFPSGSAALAWMSARLS